MSNPQRELVIILGQHRTGTSALAGALEACGLDFGPADRSPGEHNERGHFENPAITFLCEALLTPWTDVPTFGSAHEELAERVFSEYQGRRLGVKSREALYLLPFWVRLAAKTRLVATLRHPLSFARSYRSRSASNASSRGLESERFVPELDVLVEAWRTYYQDILALRRNIVFPILDFDLPIDDYLLELERTVRALDLEYREGMVRAFVSDALRHQVDRDPPSAAVAEIYAELRLLARASVSTAAAPTAEEIVRASSALGQRRREPPGPGTLAVGWQNAHTALTEVTVQLQHSTRIMTERLADAQATFDRQRAELISRFADAQDVYARQHAEVLRSSAAAQAEYERQHTGLLKRFADAQAEYASQRALLMNEIEDRDARIADLVANSPSPTNAHLRRDLEQESG